MTSTAATSENYYFVEQEEMFVLIGILSSPSSTLTTSPSSSSDGSAFKVVSPDAALSKVRTIVDKYLECPTLLDPYLEKMIQRLSLPARRIVTDLFLSEPTSVGIDLEDERENNAENSIRGCQNRIDEKILTLMRLFSAIYAISKVRGRKYVQRIMPHEVADLEPVMVALGWFGWMESQEKQFGGGTPGSDSTIMGGNGKPNIPNAIQQFQRRRNGTKENAEAKTWESLYALLIWLGIISLVPFDLNTIDSSFQRPLPPSRGCASHNDKADQATATTLVQSILATCASHLEDYGPTRETAAACLASLLSRPDLERSELDGFVDWSRRTLYWFRTGDVRNASVDKCEKSGDSNTGARSRIIPSFLLPVSNKPPSNFLVMGILQTLASIFKTGHRSNLLSTWQKLSAIEALWQECILMAEGSAGGSMILRKLLVKFFSRVGCAHLPPSVATWRYQRGRRSLAENLLKGSISEYAARDGPAKEESHDSNHQSTPQSCHLLPVSSQVEDAMDQLLRSLLDPATVVRWSAAKGIGRLTERLPAICADDVVDAILHVCLDAEQDRAWHGACLALAELARRGLLLPERLGQVVPVVIQAIGYDVRRGQHSVGTHVRDAACYVCWAFARAYAPAILRPHVRELSAALVLACLFDREVNCRRAASAAFQESVGRLGADSFKHGIAILTTADYYSLGNRNDSYLNLALDIAKFDEYQVPIARHLSDIKLLHWDIEIRVLASKSLARVSKLNPGYIVVNILPKLLNQCLHDDLVVRHGSLLGAAETVLACGESSLVQQGEVLNDEIKSSIVDLVPSIEKARLYRGRGGEIMRSAACRMIECISLANIQLTVKQQVRLLDSLDACLLHPNEEIQMSAARALNALLTNHFPVSSNGPSLRLENRVVGKYISLVQTEDNPAATRGFSLALGYLPAKLLAPSGKTLDAVLNCLCVASDRKSLVGGEGDAETRRNAIISLVNVCKTVGIHKTAMPLAKTPTYPIYHLTRSQTQHVFNSLLAAMDDYGTDRRGDVGSWSRIAAINGLEVITTLAIEASTTFPRSSGRATCEVSFSADTSSNEILSPSFERRFDFLAIDATPGVQRLRSEKKDGNGHKTFFDENLCCLVLSVMLKQFAEKLDAVRCKAGECLNKLLTNKSPRLPFVPFRKTLVQALGLNEGGKNWTDPALTFPLVMKAANIDDFAAPILSGLVVSVGGLTESVSKSSSASLLDWIRRSRSAKATQKIFRMCEVLIGLFKQNKRNGRVLLPLLATLDKLLTHGGLGEILCAENGKFLSILMSCLATEAKRCSDVKRLLAIVGVSLNLVQPRPEAIYIVQKEVLPFVMSMLLNTYPRVRCYTAEQLYVKFAEDGDLLFDDHDCLNEANQLLLSTTWHGRLDQYLSQSRNRIADLLGIQLTSEQRNVKTGTAVSPRSAPKDEFGSYSSLINNT